MRWYLVICLQCVVLCAGGGEVNDSWSHVAPACVAPSACNDTQAQLYRHSHRYKEVARDVAETMSAARFPRLFSLDPYDSCLAGAGGQYCLMDVELAGAPGHLYHHIVEYSSVTKSHYNRSILHRGYCVSDRCGLRETRGADDHDLTACVNRTVASEDDVEIGHVRVRYCQSADEVGPPPDGVDRAVSWLAGSLLVLAGLGTLHHLLADSAVVKENRYVSAFSLIHNWRTLKSGSGAAEDNFHSLQGMRFLTMFLVIGAHCFLLFAHGFISNPHYIEQIYEDPLMVWMLNGRVVVQTFFVMSGFLLSHHVFKDNKPLTLSMLPSALLNRSIRLMPVTMMSVALTATWVSRLGSGPLWQMTVGTERDICRHNWWKQVLFLQNNYAFNEVCLPQTWYIAADTQLYLVSFLVLVAVSRYPHRAKSLFSGVLLVGLLVPALHTYLASMLPIRASLFPETFRKLFVNNPTFVHGYMSAHGNWSGYTLGLLTGYLHHAGRKNNWDLQHSKILKTLYWFSLPLAGLAIWVGGDYHTRPVSSLEAALFNSLDHTVFAAAMCLFILGCIYKFDYVMRGVVEWAPLRPLGRLSFSALLLHTLFLRTYMGHVPHLLHTSIYNLTHTVSSTVVLTYGGAAAMFLLVEAPACRLHKMLLHAAPSSSPPHCPSPQRKSR